MVTPKIGVDDSQPDSAPLPVLGLGGQTLEQNRLRKRERLAQIAGVISLTGVVLLVGAVVCLFYLFNQARGKGVPEIIIPLSITGLGGALCVLVSYILGAIAGDTPQAKRAKTIAICSFAVFIMIAFVIALAHNSGVNVVSQ